MLYINDHIREMNLQQELQLVSEERRQKVLAFRHEEGQRLSVAAYRLLQQALLLEYGISTAPVFRYGDHGKPFLSSRPDLFFSLSHCRSGAMCVVSRGNVGCDIESANRKVSEAVMRRCFNSRETRAVHASSNPSLEFARIWTRKEAVGKFLGCGIDDTAPGILEEAEAAGLKIISGMNFARNYVYSLCCGKEE